MELENRTTVITGAGTGIGQATAIALAGQGANVVCAGRRAEKLQETLATIEAQGGTAMAVTTDVTQKQQVDALVEQALACFGAVDILFNNAGSLRATGGVWEVDCDAWWRDVETNLRGTMLCCHAVLPHMRERDTGIILNMSGGGAQGPLAGASAYGCSKAALLRFTDTLALELKRTGSSVLVFAVDPGFNRTAMTERLAEVDPEGRWFNAASRLDSQDNNQPEDCAQTVIELIHYATPALSGRVFHAKQAIPSLAAAADEIQEKDLLTLRFRTYG
jgi:NAD(P)-dependent dehydrogenase (short-subunit alcohol dehydrogenase family)